MATTKEKTKITIECSSEVSGREDRKFSIKIEVGNAITKDELAALMRHTRGIDKIFKDYVKRL